VSIPIIFRVNIFYSQIYFLFLFFYVFISVHFEQCNHVLCIKSCEPLPAAEPLQWESSDWPRQRQEVSAHLCGDGLHQDSLTRRFSFEEKSSLLHWSGLPPSHWTPDQPSQTLPPVAWPGYYHTTILGTDVEGTLCTLRIRVWRLYAWIYKL